LSNCEHSSDDDDDGDVASVEAKQRAFGSRHGDRYR
jgi:hypothetical protein